ncbi:MAG: family 16 glycoside hydrolase [Gimesia chilikensis]|uniref:family 16 glycoside hydrolase n=1 Tax=Gimesia chilikensis TaxID=2605989 RepID=UPI0037AA35D7
MSAQSYLLTLACLLAPVSVFAGAPEAISADHYQQTLASDDFSESELGKQWRLYKGSSVVKDGVLQGVELEGGGHAAVHQLKTEPYSDVELTVDLKFEGSPYTNLTFNQHKFKGSHAGHLCRVVVSPTKVTLRDGKTGVFNNEIFKKRQNKEKLTEAEQDILKRSQAVFPVKLKKGEWYTVTVRIKGDQMQAFIDGKLIGSLRSPGIAHPTKDMIGLVTPRQSIHYDNVKVRVP